jgi:hypothetical protein
MIVTRISEIRFDDGILLVVKDIYMNAVTITDIIVSKHSIRNVSFYVERTGNIGQVHL